MFKINLNRRFSIKVDFLGGRPLYAYPGPGQAWLGQAIDMVSWSLFFRFVIPSGITKSENRHSERSPGGRISPKMAKSKLQIGDFFLLAPHISIIFLHPNNRLLDPVSTALYLGTLGQGHWCKVLAVYGHIYGHIYIYGHIHGHICGHMYGHMWLYS